MVIFTLPRSLEEALRQAQADIEDCKKIIHCRSQFQSDFLKQRSACYNEPMLDNLQVLLAGLRDQRDERRLAALFFARDYWPTLDDIVAEALRLAFEDPNSVVRGVALFVLRRFYGCIEDPSGLLRAFLWAGTAMDEMPVAEVLTCSTKTRGALVNRRRDEWRQSIGSLLDEMLQNRGLTERHLSDSNPDVRHVAFSVMLFDWKPTWHTITICEKTSTQDPDPRIRKIAVHIIADYYSGTTEKTVARLLAKIVRDETETLEVRFAAYDALFVLHAGATSARPLTTVAPGAFRIPEDVDWRLVETFDG